jgi:hypothetical protein
MKLLSVLSLAALASAHGVVETPKARAPGAATAAVCGEKLVSFYKQDPTSYPEAYKRSANWQQGVTPQCNMYLCKGYVFDDNKDNVFNYKAGDVVDMKVAIRIPHIGYANVSVVDTKANAVIGEPLKVWASGYADGAKYPNLPKDQLEFSVKVPDLGDKCTTAGTCVCSPPCHAWFSASLLTIVPLGPPMVLVRPEPDLRVLRRLHAEGPNDEGSFVERVNTRMTRCVGWSGR